MPSLLQRIHSDGFFTTIKATFQFLEDSSNLNNAIQFGKLRILTSCDLGVKLPKSTILPHPVGIVIGRQAKIGKRVKINQNVTIAGQVTIQDDVKIGTGAFILGNITLHNGCQVGANAVVLEDVKEGTTVAGIPAEEINNSS